MIYRCNTKLMLVSIKASKTFPS